MKKLLLFSCLFVLALLSRASGQTWQPVGSAGFSAGQADYTSIAIDGSGTPYVVYQDYGNSTKATVKKFNGSTWENVGTPGFSAGLAGHTSIAIDGNNVSYVAYTDWENDQKATVKKFNGTGWVNVGSAGFSAGAAIYISIAIDGSGSPYVAYTDSGNGFKATVMKFNTNTNAWINVGSPGFSAGEAYYTSIAIDGSGTPYVAYVDNGNGNKAAVMKFNGTSWVNVGATGFSAGYTDYTSIAIDGSGTPYVVYRDLENDYKATLMKFNGSAWENVGSGVVSAGTTHFISIAIDGSGTPYVAYQDYGNGYKATAVRCIPSCLLNTLPVSNITSTSAVSGGHIQFSDWIYSTTRGICWNTSGYPTIYDPHTSESCYFVAGSFQSNLTGLTLGQKYYVRAYATNASGTSYGNELSFTTYNPENASKMSFQGLLTDAQGRLLNDGNYSITFKLYDALTGGTQVWTETQTVAVARGMVNVNLGAVNPLDAVKFNTSYWLGISVGNGSELSPRTAITGSAYPVGSIGK